MRILYFSRAYTTHDRRFLCRWAESPHEVWFLRLEDDGLVYERRPLPAKIQIVDWPGGKKTVRSLSELQSLQPHFEAVLARIQPDLVQAGPVPSCGFLAAQSGFHPLLVMSWGSDLLVEADRTTQARRLTEFALQNADMLLCDCDAVRLKAKEIASYSDDRVIQFPWGVDLREFVPGARPQEVWKQAGWRNGFVLLSVRTWAPGYGIDVLVEAFEIAHRQNPRLKLALLGDGPLATRIDGFLTAPGLQDEVLRSGRISQERLPDYFRAADLYVSCAPCDGTSISLLEALATGLPVVVSDNEGNREWVRHGENGWLARPGDAREFAELILRAATMHPAERKAIAERNRRLAEERANWDLNSSQLLMACERLGKLDVSRKSSRQLAGNLMGI